MIKYIDKIITIDNSKNQNKKVSLQEAYNWDFSITNNHIKKLKTLIQNDEEISKYKRKEILQESSRNDRRGISRNDTRSSEGKRETYRQRTDEEILHLVEKLGVPAETFLIVLLKFGIGLLMGCSSLQSIDIPNSVTEIRERVFHDCNSLEHIYLHCNDVKKLTIGKNIFYGVDFGKCILHVPSGASRAYRHHSAFKH